MKGVPSQWGEWNWDMEYEVLERTLSKPNKKYRSIDAPWFQDEVPPVRPLPEMVINDEPMYIYCLSPDALSVRESEDGPGDGSPAG